MSCAQSEQTACTESWCLFPAYNKIPPFFTKGADCKSVVSDFGGSNPPSPTKNELMKVSSFFCCMKRKISSSPRADSIFSFSLFFARPSSFGEAHFLFLLRGSAAVPVSAACAAGKLRRTIAAACWQVQRTCQQNTSFCDRIQSNLVAACVFWGNLDEFWQTNASAA